MAFSEDMTDFYDQDDFAISVTVDGVAKSAIFDEQYVEITTGRVPFSGVKPVLFIARADVEGKNGKTVVANSVSYKIVDIQHQDLYESMAVLELAT